MNTEIDIRSSNTSLEVHYNNSNQFINIKTGVLDGEWVHTQFNINIKEWDRLVAIIEAAKGDIC